jgi:hypothetical protein
MGGIDGKELGRYVRNILADIADVHDKLRPELYLAMCLNNNHNICSSPTVSFLTCYESKV